MDKKQKTLLVFVTVPLVLAWLYNQTFSDSGNWLEDYQNFFKIGFVTLSLIGSIRLFVLARKDKSNLWLIFSVLISLAIVVFLYLGMSITNISFG